MNKAKPIIMDSVSVLALLGGRKTQFRRVIRPQPAHSCRYEMSGDGKNALHLSYMPGHECVPVHARTDSHKLPCPYGVVGDRLWVMETWAPFHVGQKHAVACPVDDLEDADGARYKADGRVWTCRSDGADSPADDGSWIYAAHRWRSSSTMPRWASRLVLTVTDVRVQRVQDITDEDAIAEGAHQCPEMTSSKTDHTKGLHRCSFSSLWDGVHGEGSWDRNPWVWAVSFSVAVSK